MNLRVTVACEIKCDDARSRSESESEEGEKYVVVDPKPNDLTMGRLKQW